MTNPDKIIQLLQDEVRAAAANKYGRSLESVDAHVIARARRDYLNTQRGISIRAIESLQENNMTDQTSNPGDQQEQQEQHPADLYPFPAHWPITGPFANTDHQE